MAEVVNHVESVGGRVDGAAGDPGVPDTADLLRQQEVLREFIESISSELEFRPLLTRIVHHACELLGADFGTIGMVDEVRNVIRTEATYRMPPGELGAEMAPGIGLAGKVLQSLQPVVLDRYGDVERPTQPGLTQHAVIGMPIFWHDRMIGFFGVGAEPPRRFGSRDVETLALFARHAAVAIENARRYEREQRRIERLALIARIGRIITGNLMLDDLLQRAADAIHELLGYPNVAIPLISPEEPGILVVRTLGGFYRELIREEHRIPIAEGIMGAAARERRAMLVNDVASDPRHIPTPGATGITSELAVPIILGEQVMGVLNVEAGAPFSDEDAASLQIIADQLAVAIENARLFARVTTALQETRSLYDTSRRISTAADVDEVIEAYLSQVVARDGQGCSVALFETEPEAEPGTEPSGEPRAEPGPLKAMVIYAGSADGRGAPQQHRFPYAPGVYDQDLDQGRVVVVADIRQDSGLPVELRRRLMLARCPALAMIPLLARGRGIGIVLLSAPIGHIWSEADLRPLQAGAAQLAIALDHRRQQRLLYERGQQVAVLEERQRLARELHDSVTQLIFSTTLIAQSIAPAWRRDPAEGERRVERLLELSRSALAEMRALLVELRPLEQAEISDALPARPLPEPAPGASPVPGIVCVQRDGLVEALRRHVAGVGADGLRVDLDTVGYLRQPLANEEALFRIAQEALNNVLKHSRAAHVRIRLTVDADVVRLTVGDDGVGFAQEAPALAAGGFGLRTMRERAAALGGTVEVRATAGHGTTVDATLPPASR